MKKKNRQEKLKIPRTTKKNQKTQEEEKTLTPYHLQLITYNSSLTTLDHHSYII